MVVHGLVGQHVPWLPHDVTPVRVGLESDTEIDDVVIELDDGSRAFVQVKLTCDLGRELDATVDQWARAYKEGSLAARDTAILAVALPSNTVRQLATALTQRRSGTSISRVQRSAINKLEELLNRKLDTPDDVAAILDAAHIVVIDGRQDTADTDAGASWLDGGVVDSGQGRRGFAALRAAIPIAAAQRKSTGIDDWRKWLRDAGIPAHSDPRGVLAARRQAADDATAGYRCDIASDADKLPLHALLGGVESMLVSNLGANITVRQVLREDERKRRRTRVNPEDSRSILKVTRRQGRILVIGQAGTGKSTALHQIAAHFANISHAPVPIFASLKQIAQILPRERISTLQVSEIVEIATPGATEILRQALNDRISTGNAIFLFDALDETNDARDRIIAHLRQLLDASHPDLDLVISSRHSAADAATSLQLVTYELETPNQIESTIDQLLQHVAPDLPTQQRQHWLNVRREYIRRSQNDEPAIWSVPLLATLSVLLLADRDPNGMPATRATLLHEVIRDSVRRWAMHRADATLPSLDPSTSAAVLIDTFADVAAIVARSGTWRAAKAAVEDRLQQHWRLAPGIADNVAQAVIDHWDATAGVFVTNDIRGQLSTRDRLFAEIGDALRHTRDKANIQEWVDRAVAEPERRETVRLAAGLAPYAASALIRLASSRSDLLDLACDVWRDGAILTPSEKQLLVEEQLKRLSQASRDIPPRKPGFFEINPVSPFVRLAVEIAQLPLSQAQIARLTNLSDYLSATQLNVITAIAHASRTTAEHDSPDSTTLDHLERGLLTHGAASRNGDEERLSDRPYGLEPLVDAALRILLPARPSAARRIAITAYNSSFSTFQRVANELSSHGLDAALENIVRRSGSRASFDWERWQEELQEPFESVRMLDSEPTTLSAAQAWHLDEAAALFAITRLGSQIAGAPGAAARQFKPQMTALLNSIIEAAHLQKSTIIAQLNHVHDEEPDDPQWDLVYWISNRFRLDDLEVHTPHLTAALDGLHTGNPWLNTISLHLYLEAKCLPDDHTKEILHSLASMSAQSRQVAAIAISTKRPDISLPLTDSAVRSGHAAANVNIWVRKGLDTKAVEVLSDPDLTVRGEALRQLDNTHSELAPIFQAALDKPAVYWTCLTCDAVRSIDTESCPDTNCARPRIGIDDD